MNFADFRSELSGQILKLLGTSGFQKLSDSQFVRFNKRHEINLISIQKHSVKPDVCVNFGVHYDFLPKLGSTELPSENSIDISECEIKVRLSPDSSKTDYWWPLESNSIEEISNLIGEKTEEFFDQYNLNGAIVNIGLDDINDSLPDIFTSMTKVRTCLVLSRIHEEIGNTELAVGFARLGIEAAGMAVGPKKLLKGILKRIEN